MSLPLRKCKYAAAIITAFALIAAALIFYTETFTYDSYCSVCGAKRLTVERRLSLTGVAFFSRSSESDSPLSRVLLTNGIVQPHAHKWLFAHGNRRNSFLCALGPDDAIRASVGSEEVAAFVLRLNRANETQFQNRCIQGLLNPDTSKFFLFLLSDAQTKTPNDARQLHEWVVEESSHLDKDIAEQLTSR